MTVPREAPVPHTAAARPALRARRAMIVALAMGAITALAACDGEITGLVGAPRTALGAGGATAGGAVRLDPALIGRWQRTVVFTGADGSLNSSETSWSFAGDGSALRTVVTGNLTFGLADVVSTAALWRVEGGTLVIAFRPVGSAAVRFPYFIERGIGVELLTFGGQRYARVGY